MAQRTRTILRANVNKNHVKFKFSGRGQEINFSRKSRKTNFARLWPNWSNAVAENKKSKLNLRSRVRKNQNFPILLLEIQSIQLSKTGCNLS